LENKVDAMFTWSVVRNEIRIVHRLRAIETKKNQTRESVEASCGSLANERTA